MDTCGIVIAGGGARGAYEAGALSVLLPALETQGVAPTIFVGTSAGAINAAAFAALINYGPTEASRRVLEVWRTIRPHRVYEPIARGLARGAAATGWDLISGAPRPSIGLLDPAPLRRILDAEVPWGQIRQNLRHPELLAAVAVAATDERDYRTRLFVELDPSRPLPPPDPVRNLDYRAAELSTTHVLASSALPVVMPAVAIEDPDGTPAWYADGGVRLNAPLRPALDLGAERLVVVATAPMELSPAPRAPAPGLPAGLGQILHAILVDRMVEDLRRLHDRNRARHQRRARVPPHPVRVRRARHHRRHGPAGEPGPASPGGQRWRRRGARSAAAPARCAGGPGPVDVRGAELPAVRSRLHRRRHRGRPA